MVKNSTSIQILKIKKMKLIPDKEIDEKVKGSLSKYEIGFRCGVSFAEGRLTQLMIELLNFAFMNYDNSFTAVEPRYYDVNNQNNITTEQLFDMFMESKNDERSDS